MKTDDTPGNVRLIDGLGPLPEPGMAEENPYLDLGVMDPHGGRKVLKWYRPEQMHAYAAQERNAAAGALFQAQEAAKELLQKLQRLEAAMHWIEAKARAGKLEIAPSVRGTGFEFGFWPGARAVVLVGAPTLIHAVEAAMDKAATVPIYVSRVTECEACLTEDACRIRGQCAHYLREVDRA